MNSNRLFVDLYFRGMVKMILEKNDSSFFRGINRVAQEYARRLPEISGFEQTYLFGSRLPNITKSSFQFAGVGGMEAPAKQLLRESILSHANDMERKILGKLPPVLKKATGMVFAAFRRVLVAGMEQDLFVPSYPREGDVWLSVCSTLTASIRRLPVKRVLICYDFTHVYHFKELGLSTPLVSTLGNPAIDAKPNEWVICISEYARQSFHRFHPDFPRERVYMVPLGADLPSTEPFTEDTKTLQVLEEYGLEKDGYFLTLAAGAPHKNSHYLIEEFVKWKTESGDTSKKLVLAGAGQDHITKKLSPEARLAVENGAVYLTGYVIDANLPALYKNAFAFLFASLAEGFGLPPLEAMGYGTPVICSDKTSLPEVVGGAGLLFDPTQEGALTECLRELVNHPLLRENLILKGKARAAEFSWQRSTDRLLEALSAITEWDASKSSKL